MWCIDLLSFCSRYLHLLWRFPTAAVWWWDSRGGWNNWGNDCTTNASLLCNFYASYNICIIRQQGQHKKHWDEASSKPCFTYKLSTQDWFKKIKFNWKVALYITILWNIFLVFIFLAAKQLWKRPLVNKNLTFAAKSVKTSVVVFIQC